MCFEGVFVVLVLDLYVIVFWCEWDLCSCEVCLDYFVECNIFCVVLLIKIYLCDVNVWYVFIEGGVLESIWNVLNEDCWVWIVDFE